MEFTLVDEYLGKLAYTDDYLALPLEQREKLVFTANETLLNYYSSDVISVKAVALQTKYMFEGEEDEFAKYKRQGVKSLGLKGISLTMDKTGGNTEISPAVIALIEQEQGAGGGAFIGRLI
ncbi:hypothetical protein [Metabacillus fastidiosus]|uniref:Phage protein n=1 Tax=Metabacillus fastidiosus TaxID=1458 RepID=A0ABU6NRJ8_9BACI|nr:hypothetical protein [Metabacillus fastidiosus]